MRKTIEIEVTGNFSLPFSGFSDLEGKPVTLQVEGLQVSGLLASVGSTESRRQVQAGEVRLRLSASSAAILDRSPPVEVGQHSEPVGLPTLAVPSSLSFAVGSQENFLVDGGGASVSISGDLPPGLSWDSATSSIVGSPTTEGSWSVSISATNQAGSTSAVLQIIIATE